MSSLATQLAQTASLNASLLVDRSRRKATLSYLFTGREADQHDIEAIHALGVNSLIHLSSVHLALAKYEELLFSDRAKDIDRTLVPTEEADELNKTIEDFLWLLGPYLLEPPTGKIIEWLVRRFRCVNIRIDRVHVINAGTECMSSTSRPFFLCSFPTTNRHILRNWSQFCR